MSAYANRVDKNQKGIVETLRFGGYSVQLLNSVKNGCPDILVGIQNTSTNISHNILMEIKMPGEKLNDLEKDWHSEWKGNVYVVYSDEQALDIAYGYKYNEKY